MKLYRYLDSNIFKKSSDILQGYFNEQENLLNCHAFSPSYEYLDGFSDFWERGSNNNFFNDGVMKKYFYPSLADTLLWTKDNIDEHLEGIILEIDLPTTEMYPYFGLGYYFLTRRLEISLPYDLLYRLSTIKEDPLFYKALNLFNNRELNKTDSLKEMSIVSNLTTYNSCELYSYLCFITGIDINILKCSIANPNEAEKFCQILNLSKKTIMERKEEYSEQIESQSAIKEEVIPYLEDENITLKRNLKKYNYSFQKLAK